MNIKSTEPTVKQTKQLEKSIAQELELEDKSIEELLEHEETNKDRTRDDSEVC